MSAPAPLPPALALVYVFMGCFLGGFQLLLHKEVEGWLFPTVNFNLVGRPQSSDTSPPCEGCLYGALASLGLDHALN